MVLIQNHSPHIYTWGSAPIEWARGGQWIKAEIRRILHAAGAPFTLLPLAARNINDRLRLKQVRKIHNCQTSCLQFWSESVSGGRESCFLRRSVHFTLHHLGFIMDTGYKEKMEATH